MSKTADNSSEVEDPKLALAGPEAFVVSEEASHADGKTIPASEGSSISTESQEAATGILRAKDLDDPVDPLWVPADKRDPTGLTKVQRTGKAFKALVTEGHTAKDSFLSNSNAAIGQVIQVYPHQVALMGMVPALVIALTTQFFNYYTLWLLVLLYLERKRAKVLAGTWYDTTDYNGYRRRAHATQFHNLIGFSLGPLGAVAGRIVIALSVFGTAIAQIVASSSSAYTLYTFYNKLQWGLILGAPILAMSFLPNYRSVRIINIIALVGTNYSCLYFFIYGVQRGIRHGIFNRGPLSLQDFFLGFATIAAGGHATQVEMMDVMRRSRKMPLSIAGSLVWNHLLLIPHSYALVLALPGPVTKQSNIYSVLDNSGWKTVSVWIMYVHNICAWKLHTGPLIYMWEKLIRVHDKPYLVRAASRLPVLAVIWLVSLAIPFYGTINSLFSSLTGGMSGYVLPCLAFNWYFRTAKRRREVAGWIPGFLRTRNWLPILTVNYALILLGLIVYTGMGTTFAVKELVENISSFSFFATCYQCPKKIKKVG